MSAPGPGSRSGAERSRRAAGRGLQRPPPRGGAGGAPPALLRAPLVARRGRAPAKPGRVANRVSRASHGEARADLPHIFSPIFLVHP